MNEMKAHLLGGLTGLLLGSIIVIAANILFNPGYLGALRALFRSNDPSVETKYELRTYSMCMDENREIIHKHLVDVDTIGLFEGNYFPAHIQNDTVHFKIRAIK